MTRPTEKSAVSAQHTPDRLDRALESAQESTRWLEAFPATEYQRRYSELPYSDQHILTLASVRTELLEAALRVVQATGPLGDDSRPDGWAELNAALARAVQS
jgi:hypothetical protein